MLPINDEVFVKVEKSRGGDYFLSVYREGDPCGDEVEYFPNLYQAKKYGKNLFCLMNGRVIVVHGVSDL